MRGLGPSGCSADCYAAKGFYMFPNVKAKHESNLLATKDKDFVQVMVLEISSQLNKLQDSKSLLIRIHDAGDFYNKAYALKWLRIMSIFEGLPVEFYAYTKQVSLFKSLDLPSNFRVIYSYGGKQDHLIEANDYSASIFRTDVPKAYANASYDDKVAAQGKNKQIGLEFH
jgi:hypothetical protein